jgi:pimeloyl-ACP methyl ester carboxylesterase
MSNSMKATRAARGMSQSRCIALLLLTCCALSAQNEGHPVRNIVLVHGAWADGSGWKGVYDILVKDGYHVSIVQEPETSFQEDVAATKRVLSLQDGPCILVAHSYGGAVITEAGTDPSVAGLVYVAAHMPDAGENEADDGKRFPSDLSKSGAIKKMADGFTYLDPAQFHEYFAADLSAEQAAFMARSQVFNFADNFANERNWSEPSTSLVNRNCALVMAPCWPIPKFLPYFHMVDLAPFWLPASSLVKDEHSLLGASSRFHPSSGTGGSMYLCASAISTTTGHCAGTCVASWSYGLIQLPSIRFGTVRGISGNTS